MKDEEKKMDEEVLAIINKFKNDLKKALEPYKDKIDVHLEIIITIGEK